MNRAILTTLVALLSAPVSAQSTRLPRVAIVVLSNDTSAALGQLALALDSTVHAAGVPASAMLVRPDTMAFWPDWFAFDHGLDDSLTVADRRATALFIRLDALIEIRLRATAGAATIAVWCVRRKTERPVAQMAVLPTTHTLTLALSPQVLRVLADFQSQLNVSRPYSGNC